MHFLDYMTRYFIMQTEPSMKSIALHRSNVLKSILIQKGQSFSMKLHQLFSKQQFLT